MMEVTSSPTTNSKVPRGPLPQKSQQVQKKRKLAHEKVVVTVKVEGMKQKNEGPPSDRCSWRKYGQKPIKGSPYPRGYYRCSTSKGCPAKKQVERCRTDPSVLIITYTSNHSHADPADLLENTTNHGLMETSCHHRPTATTTPSPKQAEEPETEQKKEERNDNNEDENFRYCLQSPLCGSKNEEDTETTYDSLPKPPPRSFLVNENSKCASHDPHLMTLSSADQNSEENNDFYDELEELPTTSFFSSFMRRNFLEERILVNPS